MLNKEDLTYQKELLKAYRLKAGLSQKDVARSSNITVRQYQTFELGERSLLNASMRIGLTICKTLKLNPKLLLIDKENARG